MALKRRVLFTDDISNISLENIERIYQKLREVRPWNSAQATVAGDHVHVTSMDLNAPTEPVASNTGRRPTKQLPINCRHKGAQKVMLMQASRPADPLWLTTRYILNTSHSNARSNRSCH